MVKVIVGTQFGDEGKGRAIELLAPDVSVVARYQGGANAGHTIYVNGEATVFRLVPSGIIYPHILCVMGNGMAIDIAELINEFELLKSKGIKFEHRFFISQLANVVMPYHKVRDDTAGSIGTTHKGIGPCYEDKYARKGIRIIDLIYPELLKLKLTQNLQSTNFDSIYEQYKDFGEYIAPYVADTSLLLNQWIDDGKEVLLEGAQGLLLDIDHGTYPYVTSSHPHSGGACCGLGVAPTKIDEVIGITKAYITRVGNGPLPTQLPIELEEKIRAKGKEYGATTGRPRRCGWLDAALGKRAIMLNNIKKIILTKLDVLDDLSEIKICTTYKSENSKLFPICELASGVEPSYETLPGWKTPTTHIKNYNDLPRAAKNYIERIKELLNVEIMAICVGPTRENTILV
ncbi:MAG: adenylosuccinate synthase [Candidatus Stahlbacteria bacterium]|nr:adenylosuccinate synthase [Candidatus Stahlbacteria bacterium]